MDLPIAELVKCKLVVHIRFNQGVGVKVEARHPDKHFEHGDVVLLYLNLRRYIKFYSTSSRKERNANIIWGGSINHTLNLTVGRFLQLYFLDVG